MERDDPNMYGSGVASLIGESGISLDGQSIQLPDDATYDDDIQDDISSIHDSSYWKGPGEPPSKIKIVGTTSSDMEEGKMDQLSPSSVAPSSTKGGGGGDNHSRETTTSTTTPSTQQNGAPSMRNTKKINGKGSGGNNGGGKTCMPRWVAAAPTWLKFVIAFSTALLLGAVVLVTVALSTALTNRENPTPATLPYLTFAPGVAIPASPAASPTSPDILFTSKETTTAPTSNPPMAIETQTDAPPSSSNAATSSEIEDPVPVITQSPTTSPVQQQQQHKPKPAKPDSTVQEDNPPTSAAGEDNEQSDAENAKPPATAPGDEGNDEAEKEEPQKEEPQEEEPEREKEEKEEVVGEDSNTVKEEEEIASEPYDTFVTTFFVTGGRFTNDVLAKAPQQLRTLPIRGGTSFLVHLGDWNSPYATRCDRQSYQDVDDLFSNSSIPVYFIPGDNDFNDCPDPEEAMSFWHEYLLDYQSEYWNEPSQWTVTRGAQDQYPENFAFVYNNILFVGINLVGGVVHDAEEWKTRQAANLDWIDTNYQQNKDTIKAFVLFAHADPDVPSNSPFYEPFKERVKTEYNQVPVVLIHRNLGVEPWSWETEFENIDNFSVIVVAGSVWPPLMGAVDFRQERPFIFDQGNWYDEYIEHQTNNAPV